MFKSLFIFPFLCGVLMMIASLMGLDLIDSYVMLFVLLLGFIGFLSAALTFGRGEYLRWAFLFLTACYFCLMSLGVLSLLPTFSNGGTGTVLRVAGILGANAFQVTGVLMLARAWKISGMDFPVLSWKKDLLIASGLVFSLAFSGPAVWMAVEGLIEGSLGTFVSFSSIVSGLSDTVSLALIAPLLLTAWALRGGILSWTWIFITASILAWLFSDGIDFWGQYIGIAPEELPIFREIFQTVACLFGFSTGLSQRLLRKRIQNER
jgi:hypothetical protein